MSSEVTLDKNENKRTPAMFIKIAVGILLVVCVAFFSWFVYTHGMPNRQNVYQYVNQFRQNQNEGQNSNEIGGGDQGGGDQGGDQTTYTKYSYLIPERFKQRDARGMLKIPKELKLKPKTLDFRIGVINKGNELNGEQMLEDYPKVYPVDRNESFINPEYIEMMHIWKKQIYRRGHGLWQEEEDTSNGIEITDQLNERLKKEVQAILKINKIAFDLYAEEVSGVEVGPYNWIVGHLPTLEYNKWPGSDDLSRILRAKGPSELADVKAQPFSSSEAPPALTHRDE